ncbi:16S rRNA (adenine(1518)-N(6)/adenine(1519)-N(6))-dimethyltransferase RsmA [Simkania sp.]|uniref:16S rRNA (adenine(1518)-N(6)/adenine(1519)-N(6))- dimethyltransferase RsmA n=1 Tax=Simkania sp. TaxID=34094 RepID=UPI003B52550E
MGLYQPKALKKLLEDLKTHPRKSLSQNFLIDGNIVRKIIESSTVVEGDHVLEVGPGPGVLTEALLEKGANVTAIEKDDRFAAALQDWSHPKLNIVHDDFLKVDLPSVLKKKTKVVANIPYNITGILLQKLLPMGKQIASLTLMVQKEVAERLVAKKGTNNYSSFTLFASYYSTPQLLFSVEPTCFYPKPKVTSAVVQLTLKEVDENAPSPLLLIRKAFQQRRKMLRASLKSLYPATQVESALKEMGLAETARPQELSLEEFQKLYNLLTQ